LYKPHSVKG